MEITYVIFGDVDQEDIFDITTALDNKGYTMKSTSEAPVIEEAYDPRRDQYLADTFLEWVSMESGLVLGITDVDLYTEGLNFVFGLADIGGRAAVISLFHLKDSDRVRYIDRAVKEALHEIGHALGLHHCHNYWCVMHFSNTVWDTDRKSTEYCSTCEEKLRHLTGMKGPFPTYPG